MMVCNLNQNPHRRPISSSWLPALLKSGTMWLLRGDVGDDGEPIPQAASSTNDTIEERYLLDVETDRKSVV